MSAYDIQERRFRSPCAFDTDAGRRFGDAALSAPGTCKCDELFSELDHESDGCMVRELRGLDTDEEKWLFAVPVRPNVGESPGAPDGVALMPITL